MTPEQEEARLEQAMQRPRPVAQPMRFAAPEAVGSERDQRRIAGHRWRAHRARVALDRATGQILAVHDVNIEEARTGKVNRAPASP